jgi:hypothetical protein
LLCKRSFGTKRISEAAQLLKAPLCRNWLINSHYKPHFKEVVTFNRHPFVFLEDNLTSPTFEFSAGLIGTSFPSVRISSGSSRFGDDSLGFPTIAVGLDQFVVHSILSSSHIVQLTTKEVKRFGSALMLMELFPRPPYFKEGELSFLKQHKGGKGRHTIEILGNEGIRDLISSRLLSAIGFLDVGEIPIPLFKEFELACDSHNLTPSKELYYELALLIKNSTRDELSSYFD